MCYNHWALVTTYFKYIFIGYIRYCGCSELFVEARSTAALTVSAILIAYVQWGKKVFSQPPIVQVLPLKKMREACNFHHRYTSIMTDKIRKKIQKITL